MRLASHIDWDSLSQGLSPFALSGRFRIFDRSIVLIL